MDQGGRHDCHGLMFNPRVRLLLSGGVAGGIWVAPPRAAGLTDRGVLAEGRRADIILVDDEVPLRPRIVAVIAAGRLVHLTDADRLIRFPAAPRKAVAAA